MSGALVGLVLDVEELSRPERWVLATIAEDQRGARDVVIRSVEWIARRSGLGESTVRRVLPMLRDKGYLSFWGGGGKAVVHRYQLAVIPHPVDEKRFLWAVENLRNPLGARGYEENETLSEREGMALNPLGDDANPLGARGVPSPVGTPSSGESTQTSLLLSFDGGRTDRKTVEKNPTSIDVDALVDGVRGLGYPTPMRSEIRDKVIPFAMVNGHTADTLLAALKRDHTASKINHRNGTITVLRDVARNPAPPPKTTAPTCPHKRPNGDRFTKDGDSLGGCRECEADAQLVAEQVAVIAAGKAMP